MPLDQSSDRNGKSCQHMEDHCHQRKGILGHSATTTTFSIHVGVRGPYRPFGYQTTKKEMMLSHLHLVQIRHFPKILVTHYDRSRN